jgi:cysteinyl-tRNA synthetase
MEKTRHILLYNTLGRQLEFFKPAHEVKMYVCGITPYDYAHLGHGRCYVTFDLLYRVLRFLGHSVTYCRNFTDIDDKLINRADKELNDPTQYLVIANTYIESFHNDMKMLNCISPTYEPRVTTHIVPIIEFIQGLIAEEKAYVTILGDVYFRISSFKEYGKLSQRSIADLKAGARVAVREDKEDPLDFALWKFSDEPPGWESPWGFGRPGWHIECSAMAQQYLGTTIDIHGGGMDLIFPHHENEIAQSEGLSGKPFSRFWVHNAFVRVNEEKMSKSLGNFLTLRDAYTKFHPMVLRYYYLIHHYRNPLDFSAEDIESAAISYRRLCSLLESIDTAPEQALHSDIPLDRKSVV